MKRFVSASISLFLWVIVQLSVYAQADIKALDKYLEKARQDWGIPGMAVSVVKDGKIVLSKGYGTLEVNKDQKADEHTLFAIASNTKAFVASALATLVSDGKIRWDDKVRQYLPYFELYDHYVSNETTIEDLLCHRIGLGTFSGDVIWYRSTLTAEEIVKKAKYIPQDFDFRAGFGYSNVMYIAAGEVIQAVTGKPWSQYVKETFFTPLGMDRTITSVKDLEEKGNYATPHKPVEDQTLPIAWEPWDNSGAAGGILTSAHDMGLWLMFNLNHGIWGKDTLLLPYQQNILWTPHNNYVLSEESKRRMPGRHFSGYGLGWGLSDYHGRMIVSHGGAYDGMYSRVAMVPDENLGVVVMTNSMKGISTPLTYYVINAFIKADDRDWSKEYLQREKGYKDDRIEKIRKSRVPDTKPTHPLEAYTGTYEDNMYGEITIALEKGELTMHFSHAPELAAKLKHWHYDTWEIQWKEQHAWFGFGTVQFDLNGRLEIKGLRFDIPNDDIFFYELNPVKIN